MLAVYKWDAARGLLADITPGWWPIFGSQWSNRGKIGRVLKALSTGDFNGDGIVNGADFGSILAAWGTCGGCPEDLDGNGEVNGADVGLLLAVWGPCP